MSQAEKKLTILIVDDMPKNIQVAAGMLSRQGYQIAFDENGESALLHTKEISFDLILLDIIMPGMDGYEVCRRLKDNPETKAIPVIFLTGKTDTESIVKGFEIGAADYVTKPFNETELLARVNTHLELRKHRKYLENLVQERTAALRVMLEVREETLSEHEEKIAANIIHRLFPIVETLREHLTTLAQQECLTLIEAGLAELFSESAQKLSSPRYNLTQTEIKIAGLIRNGKSAKQIGNLLGIGENTILFHRSNIRKKLGLTHLKTNLRVFLQAMES